MLRFVLITSVLLNLLCVWRVLYFVDRRVHLLMQCWRSRWKKHAWCSRLSDFTCKGEFGQITLLWRKGIERDECQRRNGVVGKENKSWWWNKILMLRDLFLDFFDDFFFIADIRLMSLTLHCFKRRKYYSWKTGIEGLQTDMPLSTRSNSDLLHNYS